MIRKGTSPIQFAFTRKGGAIIRARVDIWRPTATEWELAAQVPMDKVVEPSESVSERLKKGTYLCVFQCMVEESLNGRYEFVMEVAGKATFNDSGDVNTTPNPADRKVYDDQFILEVTK
ncbi:MAG: hypothetical protein ACKVQU_05315 [Burkholderiales bacterium]